MRILRDNLGDVDELLFNAGIRIALSFCVKHTNLHTVTKLVKEFALDEDNIFPTLLMQAITCKKWDIPEYLLAKSTHKDLHVKGMRGYTVLYFMVRSEWDGKSEIALAIANTIMSICPELIYEKNDDEELPLNVR